MTALVGQASACAGLQPRRASSARLDKLKHVLHGSAESRPLLESLAPQTTGLTAAETPVNAAGKSKWLRLWKFACAVEHAGAILKLRRLAMASLDWSQCPAVESIPGKVSGAWVFRGTRMPVQTVFENLEAGMSLSEITEVFDVTPEEVRAVLRFASDASPKRPPSTDENSVR